MLHTPSAPEPAPEPDLRSATMLAALRRCGLRPRLLACECCGERDLRIRVGRGRLGPAVELLCCPDDEPEPAHWDAVRVTGRDRRVWRGPPCDADLADVVAFVDDLLTLGEEALSDRYLALG